MKLENGNIVDDLQRWADTYLQEVKNKNLAKRTIEIYTAILDGFIEYSRQFQDEAGLEDINRVFLNAYLTEQEQKSNKFSGSTRKLHITVLKTFFGYITENNDNNTDFYKIFKKMSVKIEHREKPALSDDDVTKLLNFFEIEKKAPRNRLINYRNSLLCKTMLYGGVRAHELLDLRLKDFVLNAEYEVYSILVKGKGNKERYVYVPYSIAADEIETLKEEVKAGGDWPICTTRNNTIISLVNLYQILTGIYKRAGIDKKGLHILRHTMARRHVSQGVNLETIRDLLGHSNISTTSTFYAKTSENNKMAAIAQGKKQTTMPR